MFKRETDDHTMFLYKDINRRSIFLTKFFSLALILVLYFVLFFIVTLFVHYTRVVNMDFGSSRLGSDDLYSTIYAGISMLVIFLKVLFFHRRRSLPLFTFRNRSGTMGYLSLSIAMTITSIIEDQLHDFPKWLQSVFQKCQ